MVDDMARHAVVDLLPHLAGGHRAELVVGDFDGESHFAAMPDVDDGSISAGAT